VSNNRSPKISAAAVAELFESATTLSADHGELVEQAVREAAEHPLDEQHARRLYTRLIEILREGDDLDDEQRAALAEQIREEVDRVVGSVKRPRAGVEFIEHNGLAPRKVVPLPTFNNKPIPMEEGYVDVETLRLWDDNQRVALHVAEFRERNGGRHPTSEELVSLMQGSIRLPSLKKNASDPFNLKPLADSIARKGVEVPPIITHEGEPKDGNRRIAASLLVLYGKDYDAIEKERARYIRVWRAPKGTTDDLFHAIVVSRNFETDHKEPWPEFIKARLVVDEYERRRREIKGVVTKAELKRVREGVAKDFALKPVSYVERYDKMIRWADEFSAYHEQEGRDPAAIRYKTENNFQWFIELDAGVGNEKLTRKLDTDDNLKSVVFDLMFDVLDSGAQVRNLYRVVNDAETAGMLLKAHEVAERDPDGALELVEDAITEAKRRNIKRRSIGFEDFLKTLIDRLGTTPPNQWTNVDTELLLEVRRVMTSTLGAIEGQTTVRRAHGEDVST
jgi:hypothetical protein